VSKWKGLTKKYRFSQEELKVVPKDKSLAKRYKFRHEKIESTKIKGW
jgi:hypothetical protein